MPDTPSSSNRATPSPACCDSVLLSSCCEPEAKAACCGPVHQPASCGCRPTADKKTVR